MLHSRRPESGQPATRREVQHRPTVRTPCPPVKRPPRAGHSSSTQAFHHSTAHNKRPPQEGESRAQSPSRRYAPPPRSRSEAPSRCPNRRPRLAQTRHRCVSSDQTNFIDAQPLLMNPTPPCNRPLTSRRNFLKTSSQAMAGVALTTGLARPGYTAEQNTIKVALMGCGGRGTGAAGQALSTQGPTKLWAVADVFPSRVDATLGQLRARHADQIDVPPERRFVGLDGYKKAIDSLDKGDVVILATPRLPPHAFRIRRPKRPQCLHGKILCRRCTRHPPRPARR
jgi:hypothetical protein